MPSIVDREYSNKAYIILYKVIHDKDKRGVGTLKLVRRNMPIPFGRNNFREYESVVVEYSDGIYGHQQNVPIFITSAPLQTKSVYFSFHTSVLTRKGWLHDTIQKSLGEVRKYSKILSYLKSVSTS